jgi:hypothetical protein
LHIEAAAATPPPVTAYPFTHFLARAFFSLGSIVPVDIASFGESEPSGFGLPVAPVGLPQFRQKACCFCSKAVPQLMQYATFAYRLNNAFESLTMGRVGNLATVWIDWTSSRFQTAIAPPKSRSLIAMVCIVPV